MKTTVNTNVPRSDSHPTIQSRIGRRTLSVWSYVFCCILPIVGCQTYHNFPETLGNNTDLLDSIMMQVDQGAPPFEPTEMASAPMTLRTPEALDAAQYRDLSLQEAVQIALTNGDVLRDLGATVIRSPQAVLSTETGQLAQTDPQFGVEAALSAFDTQFYAFGKWQNNDRKFNNRFFGGGANAFQQDTHDYVFQLTKRTPTGAQLAIRSVIDYDANNATGNLTRSAWQAQFHAEARQPLLQGGGMTFNRIAGPGARPGVYSGITIAKVNHDITNANFEQNVRDYVSNVVNAYWDLYFSYRDLDAKRESFERSRKTWQSYEAQKSSNRKSGAVEALAREQYYRFQAELQDAIAGKQLQRTQVNNASSGGTFAGVGGVQSAERRLRLLIGLPISDGALLRPLDEPSTAPIAFDWDSISLEAMRLRTELQQQRLLVKRREMELLAAKNFLMPQLDLVSIWRVRGLDEGLAGPDSAFKELGSFDFQEYEASLELKMPIGFRQGHLAVRNAKIQLARDRAVLREQERQILHDLSAVVAECDRAFVQMETNLNRFLAASDALETLEASREAGMPVNLEQILDAQRRASESQSRYFQSLAEYTIANKNVQFEKGTLLETTHLFMSGSGNSMSFALPAVPPEPIEEREPDSESELEDPTSQRTDPDEERQSDPTRDDNEPYESLPQTPGIEDSLPELESLELDSGTTREPNLFDALDLEEKEETPVRNRNDVPASLVAPASHLEEISLEVLNP